MGKADLKIPRESNPAGAYVQGLLPFVWGLREYGFTPTAQEIEQALSSVRDITDVEDVLYTAQSALCHNKEQADAFETLFCQKFLGYKQEYIGAETPKRPTMSDEALESLKKNAERIRQDLSRAEADEANADVLKAEWEAAQEKADQAKVAVEQAKHAIQTAIANTIRSSDRKFLEVLQQGLSGIQNEEERTQIRNAVEMAIAQANGAALEELKVQMLNKALDARRRKDNRMYRTYALLSAEMQKISYLLKKLSAALEKTEEFEQLEGEVKRAKEEWKPLRAAAERAWKAYDLALEREKMRRSAKAELKSIEGRIRSAMQEKERYEAYRSSLIRGGPSVNHREMFIGGHNAVQREDAVESLLNSDIAMLTADEIQTISLYIRTNARKFQQTLRKNMAAHQRKRLDIKKTVEKSMRTDGDIARLYYRKPRASKARIILLADISGSCRASASLALHFMGLMGQVFPGGCHPFVFVNHLVPVGQFFRDDNVEAAVQAINASVPSRGIYSNYGTPLHQLVTEHRGLISKDTTVILLGDCRNNLYDTAQNQMRWMCEHAHQVSMLVPEEQAKWGTGDSIVPVYQAAGAEAVCVQTAQQLIEFLLSKSITHD